ncbi:hypothetical protein COO60DRAFT_646603 [Scenedesmus sp. NREL 46B-D3]|nr:hypothetical protein COO60DRAFT_646603 [Scenedesmus sp. NREL 46B-D3]
MQCVNTLDLSSSQVGAGSLPSLYYFPNYIDEAEEQRILKEVHASQAKWVQLSGRRLQNHGGIVHSKGLIPAHTPRWLEQLSARIHRALLPLFGEQPPNHVLINSYQPGCGIMPHEDGPLYHPVVSILSLGSPAVLRFWRKQEEGGTGNAPAVASVLAMPRSLLVFTDEAYHSCLHGIEEVTEERLDASVVNPEALEQQQQQHHHQGHQQETQQQTQQQRQQQGQASCGETCAPPAAQGNSVGEAQQGDGCSGSFGDGSSGCGTDAITLSVPRQGARVSLTIRRVLRVHKALGLLKR